MIGETQRGRERLHRHLNASYADHPEQITRNNMLKTGSLREYFTVLLNRQALTKLIGNINSSKRVKRQTVTTRNLRKPS